MSVSVKPDDPSAAAATRMPDDWHIVVLPWLLLCVAILVVGAFAYHSAKRAVVENVALDTEAVARLKASEVQLWLADHDDVNAIPLPLIQRWPSFRRSAEILLMRRDGSDVVFLGIAGQPGAPPLETRRSLDLPNFIAARVLREGSGFYAADDYRGVPSLGYGVAVSGTPWYVIAKMDRTEAFAELELIAAICAVMLGVLMAVCAWWLARRKRDEAALRMLNRTVGLLSHCNRALAEAESEQALLDAICRLVVDVGGYRMAWIGYPQHDAARSVRAAARYGHDPSYLDVIKVSWADDAAGSGPTGRALREAATQVNPDFRTNAALATWREEAARRGYASSVALPLVQGRDVLGALTIYAPVSDAFCAGEVALLEDLARDLARGIAVQRLRVAHRTAAEDLRLSEERMRGLFGSISDALFVHSMRPGGKLGCFVEVNDVACSRLGYRREELLRMSHLDINAPGCPDDVEGIVARLLTGESVIFESVHVAKDGRRIPVEINSSSFVLRGERMFVSLARDITERRRFEQERVESEHQLATLSAHLQSVRESERAIIARELHDELGQVLTALKMDISWLHCRTPVPPDVAAKLVGMAGLVDATLGTVRRMVADLRPTMLDDLGLAAAIEWLVEEFAKRHPHIACQLVVDLGGHEVGGVEAITAYRIVQECLTNVARHAEASKLHVVVGIRGERLAISIQDNGRGLAGGKPAGGFGLLGMRQRVQALGGAIAIDSMPGEGLSVDVEIPLGLAVAEAPA